MDINALRARFNSFIDRMKSTSRETFLKYLGISFGASILLWLGKRYFNGPACPVTSNLEDQVIIVTGSNSGIGLYTAEDLILKGAKVIYACRDENKAQEAIQALPDKVYRQRAHFMKLDLADFDSIINFVKEFKKHFNRLDILINNAGLVNNTFTLTKDKIENTFQCNYFGPALLTLLLLDYLHKEEGRIINVSSVGSFFSSHTAETYRKFQADLEFNEVKKNYSIMSVYCDTKLAYNFFVMHIAEMFEKSKANQKIFALCPGYVRTNINNTMPFWVKIIDFVLYPILWYISKPMKYGASTTLYVCYEDFKRLKNGAFYQDCKEKAYSDRMKNIENREELLKWTVTVLDNALRNKGVNIRALLGY